MKKKLFIILILMLIILPYKVKGATGSLSISCTPSTLNAGESAKCVIAGTIDAEITSISLDFSVSDNLTIISFTPNDIWEGSDIDNGKIDIYTKSGDTIKSDFTLGTLDIKVKDNTVNSDEKISFSSIIFYYDGTEYNINSTTVNIRVPSNVNTLTNIKVNNNDINFNESTTTYNLTVDSDSVVITTTKKDSNSTVSGDGTKKLDYGKNVFNIVVTSESGSKKTYTLNITRPDNRSTENRLSEFAFANYDIDFNKDKTDYSVIVDNNVSKLVYSLEEVQDDWIVINKHKLADSSSTERIFVNDKEFYGDSSDNNYAIISDLNVGNNILKIVITAENGDERVYTFNINRKTEDGEVIDDYIIKSPSTGNTFIIIIGIILVISFGIVVYFVYKRSHEKVSDSNKE